MWVIAHMMKMSHSVLGDAMRLWFMGIPLFAGQCLIIQAWRMGSAAGWPPVVNMLVALSGAVTGTIIGYLVFIRP